MSDVTLYTARRPEPARGHAGEHEEERWSPGRTLRFVVYSSLGLWSLIIATVVSLL